MVSNPSRTLLLQLIDSTPVTVARIVYMSMPIEMPIDNQISLRLVILVSRTRKAYYIAHHFFMSHKKVLANLKLYMIPYFVSHFVSHSS